MSRARAFVALALLAACGGGDAPPATADPTAVVLVTLTTRSTVLPAQQLHVSFANAGTEVTRDFDVPADAVFPQTLTVTAPGRSGELVLDVAAADASGATIARGTNHVALDPAGQVNLSVTLEPEDFVVNARTPASQLLARNPDLSGRQTAVRDDGSILLAWETDCASPTSCNIYARRLDAAGRPVASGDATAADDLVASQ
jgi:hypothetical protein